MTDRCALRNVLTFYQHLSFFYEHEVVGQKKKFEDPFDEHLKSVYLLSIVRLKFRTLDNLACLSRKRQVINNNLFK